jgi:hypothetical protein
MTVSESRHVPAWYWILAVLALLWEGFGCFIYTSEALVPQAERVGGYAAMASWQWGVFAVAVWSGLAGAIGLLLRKNWARLLLTLSLVAAAIQYGYSAVTTGLGADALPVAFSVLLIGAILVWFARYAGRRGWLS